MQNFRNTMPTMSESVFVKPCLKEKNILSLCPTLLLKHLNFLDVPPFSFRVQGVSGKTFPLLALRAGDRTGEGTKLCWVSAPDAAAAEEPRVGDLFPALEVTLEHVGVSDGELGARWDGDLGLQHKQHVLLGTWQLGRGQSEFTPLQLSGHPQMMRA